MEKDVDFYEGNYIIDNHHFVLWHSKHDTPVDPPFKSDP
jgi:hypothetical protein